MHRMKLAKKLLIPLLCIVLSACHSPAVASQAASSTALGILKKLKLSDIPKLLSLIQKNPRPAVGGAALAYIVYRIWKYTKGQPSAFMQERRMEDRDIHNSVWDTVSYSALGILGYKYLFNPKLLHRFGAYDDEPDYSWLVEIMLHGAALAKLCDLTIIWRRNTHDATIRALKGNNVQQAVDYQQGYLGRMLAPDSYEILSKAIQEGDIQVVSGCLLPNSNRNPNSMIMADYLHKPEERMRKPEERIQRFAAAVDQARQKLNEDPDNINRKVILDMLTQKQENVAHYIGRIMSQPTPHIFSDGTDHLPESVARRIGRMLTGSSVVEAREKTAQHKPVVVADRGDAKSN